jgi:hypothetical protein
MLYQLQLEKTAVQDFLLIEILGKYIPALSAFNIPRRRDSLDREPF